MISTIVLPQHRTFERLCIMRLSWQALLLSFSLPAAYESALIKQQYRSYQFMIIATLKIWLLFVPLRNNDTLRSPLLIIR